MTCEQCGMAIGERWYRIRLKDNAIFHVLCLMSLWEIGDAKYRLNFPGRMKALRAYSPVQMPTGHLPTNGVGL